MGKTSKKASVPPRIAKRNPVKALIAKAMKTGKNIVRPEQPSLVSEKSVEKPQLFAMGGIAKIRLGQSTKDGKQKPKKGKS